MLENLNFTHEKSICMYEIANCKHEKPICMYAITNCKHENLSCILENGDCIDALANFIHKNCQSRDEIYRDTHPLAPIQTPQQSTYISRLKGNAGASAHCRQK